MQPAPGSIAVEPSTADRLAALAGMAELELREHILPFWLGLRDAGGAGFVGAATDTGRALPSAPKGAVLHARILWALSASYLRFPDPALLDSAAGAYQFLSEHLVDPVAGGVFWTSSADGTPADRQKHVYAQAFAIYGLAAFHRASGRPEPLHLARQLWWVVERAAADPRGEGYFESFSADWQVVPNLLMGRTGASKTFNTHFHLLEAYGALWEVWPDPMLRSRIEMLTALLTGPVVLDRRRNTFRQFFTDDWRNLDDGLSYGHDIEASWLIPALLDRLTPEIAASVRETVSGIADAVLDRAVDLDGGVLTGFLADGGFDRSKVWWVQAEALVGFLDAFEHRREKRFLRAAEGVWKFIDRSVIDRAGGEWRWRIAPAGVTQPILPKADIWKCPYHNGRACLEVITRAARLANGVYARP
jgi:mannobiose 2-epimerase